MTQIRQPIVTVCGHVDHGKTSILDCLRGTAVQEGEAGGITQKISFTRYPLEQLKIACPLIEKSGIALQIPGFLLIDTPGHAAFTNLRKRGGSLADLAILVIDINEGIKPQTVEVIKILKHHKTPFVIALNKIDNISGWKKNADGLQKSIEKQQPQVKQLFEERYYTLIGSLQSFGLDADLFFNITDFTKKIALVPVSAKTREGIPELIMMLCGLSQKYLTEKLTLHDEPKGVLLEVKKDQRGNMIEAILYDGTLKRTDEIIVAQLNKDPIVTKIRILEEIEPLSNKFSAKESVSAATGIRIQLIEKDVAAPGMPFVRVSKNIEAIKEQFKKEIGEAITTEKQGIIAKADSLGSLEALLFLLKEQNIPVLKAGIGPINKTDVINAKANREINELDAVIIGFNVGVDEDAKELSGGVKILMEEVVYKLIDEIVKFRKEKAQEIEKARLMKLAPIGKLEILHQYVFRNTSPAIFGVRVLAGKIRANVKLMDENGVEIGHIKNLQAEKKSVEEATEGTELAISLPGVNVEREIAQKHFLYTTISESQFRIFKKNKDLLSAGELKILQEIADMYRRTKSEWGV